MENQDLYTTAELAELELSEAEIEKLGEQITQILEYFEKMKEIDVDDLEPTTHALLRKNRIRGDFEHSEIDTEEILNNAPERDEQFITIPRIL